MKRSIALVLVMMMFMTMLTPMHAFGSEYSRINLFYILDPAVQQDPNVDVYGTSMQVSLSHNGSSNSFGGSLFNFTNYTHESIQVGSHSNVEVFINSFKTGSFYSGNFNIDTNESGNRIIIIGFDPTKGENAVTFTEMLLPIDVTFEHEDPNYMVAYAYAGGKILHTNQAVASGAYQVFYVKQDYSNTPSTLKVLSENVSVDGTDVRHVGNVNAGPITFTTALSSSGLHLVNDQLFLNHNYLASVNGVDQIETTVFGLQRFLTVVNGYSEYSFFVNNLELNLPIDLTAINVAPTASTNFNYDVNLNQLFMFTDANGHDIQFNYLNGGSFEIESATGSISGPINGTYFGLSNLSGPATVTIDIPDLGISATRTIHVGGAVPPPPVPSYKDVQVEINDDATGLPREGVFSVYEPDQNYITLYIPENSMSELVFRGVNQDDTLTEPLTFNLNNQSHPQYIYSGIDRVLSLGAVQGGYRDMVGGYAGNVGVTINVYKGTLGKIVLENADSTEEEPSYFSGEVQYSISYKYTDGGVSGSRSNGWAHDGLLFIPMQDGALGVSYAYSVLSPSQVWNASPQANTKFLDFSDNLSNIQNGFIELGHAKFQEPSFRGEILKSDGSPASGLHTNLTTFINSELIDLQFVDFNVGMWSNGTAEQNIFYFAPLGEMFSEDVNVNIVSYNGSIKPLESTFKTYDHEKTFKEASDQLIITMFSPDGAPMESGPGLDRSIRMFEHPDVYSKVVYIGNVSTASIGNLKEGSTYTLQLAPDMGDFGHRRYVDGKAVTFTYTSIPGAYNALDSTGSSVPYHVDDNGVMHLSLCVQYAQVYGQVYLAGVAVTADTTIILYDKATGLQVGNGRVHTDGGYNGMPTVYGLFLIGNDTPLVGEYTLVVEDPKDTVMFSGTTVDITLPLNEPLVIELPRSKVFGDVTLHPEDTVEFANSITRVYVNVFDAAGKFLKNVLVRRDGRFSVGELADGKYFAKVFVSPFSTLATKYASSRMTIFHVNNNTEESMNFNALLTRVIGEGVIKAPNGIPKQEAWVRVYNSQGVEIEAMKSNDQGIFKIPMLQDGTYKLRAFGTDGFTDSLVREFTVSSGVITSGGIELSLTMPEFTGQAIDSNNNVINDVTALLFDKDKNLISSIKTQNGSFNFGGLEHGNYFVQVRPNQLGAYVPSSLVAFQYGGIKVDLSIPIETASFQGKVYTPSGKLQKSGWVHVYLDNLYETSVQIDEMGQFVLGTFDPTREISIFAEDDMGRYMPSERIVLDTPEDVVLSLREDIGFKTSLMHDVSFLTNTKYIIYNSSGHALYQGTTNAFGEMALVDVPFGEYTVVVPMDNCYLIGKINFIFNGQFLASVPLTKGEIK